MSHHSSDKPLAALFANKESQINKLTDLLKQEKARQDQLNEVLGPTNDFPDGKIVPHDEGGLMFGVTVFNGRVIMDFGKPIRSIGFTREGALELAELIRRRAEQCPPVLFKTNA